MKIPLKKVDGRKTYLTCAAGIIGIISSFIASGTFSVESTIDTINACLPWLAGIFGRHAVSKIKTNAKNNRSKKS